MATVLYNLVVHGSLSEVGNSTWKSVMETELVEDTSREALWRIFRELNRQNILREGMNYLKFNSMATLCETAGSVMLRHRDIRNLTWLIYHTQGYKSNPSAGDSKLAYKYQEGNLLRDEEVLVEAICTLIEVVLVHQGRFKKSQRDWQN